MTLIHCVRASLSIAMFASSPLPISAGQAAGVKGAEKRSTEQRNAVTIGIVATFRTTDMRLIISAALAASLTACVSVHPDNSIGVAQTHGALNQSLGLNRVSVPSGTLLRGAMMDGHT